MLVLLPFFEIVVELSYVIFYEELPELLVYVVSEF
jgi:hypothetical protein